MSDSVKQITDMMFRYAELFDTGRFDEFAALFEHGRWHKADPGAAAARAWIDEHVHLYDGQTRTKHVTTNLAIEVDEEAGTAVSRAYFTALQTAPGLTLQPIVSGRYHDRFERADGKWRFVERRVRTDLVGNVSRHLRQSAADQ